MIKTILLSILLFLSALTQAQNINFTDVNFKKIVNPWIDSHIDKEINNTKAESVRVLSDKGVLSAPYIKIN